MSYKQFVIATLAGGITLFLLGLLAYGLLLKDFFIGGLAPAVLRETPIYWVTGLGELTLGALLAFVIGNGSSAPTPAGGLVAGMLVGSLVALAEGLTAFGTTITTTIGAVLVDTVVTMTRMGIAGAVCGAVLTRRASLDP